MRRFFANPRNAVMVFAAAALFYQGYRLSAADEPAVPKQILVPFNEAEQKGMNDLQRDMNVLQLRVENFRLSKCLQESIPAAQCGQLAPTGVYRLVASEKK